MTGFDVEPVQPLQRNCWRRVRSALVARGQWSPVYAITIERGCSAVALYARMAAQGASAADLQLLRATAREWLIELHMLPPGRVHLGPVDEHGHDAELLALVRPEGAA